MLFKLVTQNIIILEHVENSNRMMKKQCYRLVKLLEKKEIRRELSALSRTILMSLIYYRQLNGKMSCLKDYYDKLDVILFGDLIKRQILSRKSVENAQNFILSRWSSLSKVFNTIFLKIMSPK